LCTWQFTNGNWQYIGNNTWPDEGCYIISSSSSASSSGSSSASSSGSSSASSSESSSASSSGSSSSISEVCNVVGCAGADENASFIDCGLVDPNCYFDCDICDCICDSSNDSLVSEGGSSGGSEGGSSGGTSESTDCCNLEGLVKTYGPAGCWTARWSYSRIGDSNCFSASGSKCGESVSCVLCCNPDCLDYTNCGCFSWTCDYECVDEDPSKDIRTPCGCGDPGVLVVGGTTIPGCRTCCGCDAGSCVLWGSGSGGAGCSCPSSNAICCGDADSFCIHTVPGDPNQSCIDGLEGIPGGDITACCDCGATVVDQGTYDLTGQVVCKETFVGCGPPLGAPPPVECEGGAANCLFVYNYHCALKQEWVCELVPASTEDEEDSCQCFIASESYVPCSECVNTQPPSGEEECEGWTYCQYYDCNELINFASHRCTGASAELCGGPSPSLTD
jgi:hypothetical protein